MMKARRQVTMTRLRREIEDNQTTMTSEKTIDISKSTIMIALRNEDTNSKILSLIDFFSIINQFYFKQIMKNKFDLINIFKLCIDVSIVKFSKKFIIIVKELEIVINENDVSYTDIKDFIHLLRCLVIY